MKDEINFLIGLARDPKRMYDVDEALDDQFSTMQVDNEKTKINKPGGVPLIYKSMNVRLPVLKEDARITIKRDDNLMIRAGGYCFEKAYSDLGNYSRIGLI